MESPSKDRARSRFAEGVLQVSKLPAVVRYAIPPAATALAFLIQDLLVPEPSIAPFVVFFFAVVLASLLAGRAAGLATVALSGLTANYYFLRPGPGWSLGAADLTVTALFVISAGSGALLSGSLRGALESLQRAAEKLHASQARWKSLFEHAPIPVWEEDFSEVQARFEVLRAGGVQDLEPFLREQPDEVVRLASLVRIVEVSRAARSVFDLSEASDLSRRLPLFTDERSLAVFSRELVALWRGETSFASEAPIVDLAGRPRVLELRLAVIPGTERTLSRVVGSFMDVTARREVEAQLRRQSDLLRLSHDAILVWSLHGAIELWNRGAEELYGFAAEEALGKMPNDLLSTVFPLPWEELVSTLCVRGRWEGELRHRHRSGRELVVSARLQLVHGDDGVDRVLETNRDITERKRMEEALRESSVRKDDFLAVLSHELRNPLTPIRNCLYILERAQGEQAARARAVIARQVTQMTRLIDQLLDVTRIARGKVRLRKERLDLGELTRRTAEDLRTTFEQAGVELEVEVPPHPLWVDGDEVRLGQVLGNLLQNAAKFTPRGGRTVLAAGAGEAGEAVLRVRDTGAGIAPELLPRVFDPFAQGETTLDRSRGGLGLGLALVKGLVELHGGQVTAQSAGADSGSEFVVRLPLAHALPTSAEVLPPSRAPGRARSVLVVEDNVDAAESLRELLELNGHEVEVARTGTEGLEKARRLRPDLVLCDLGLPEMDGFEVARAIRADPALRETRLVALSGYAHPEDVRRALAAGFAHHLVKPPDREELDAVLADRGASLPGAQAHESLPA